MKSLPKIAVMRRAFAEKDSSYDGTFFVAVKSTGIFCRVICRARPPLAKNVEFFGTTMEALACGYRPCKLCKPLGGGAEVNGVVKRLLEMVERRFPAKVVWSDLVEAGIDPTTARRQFRKFCGMTFAAYQRAKRLGNAVTNLQKGARMTQAQTVAGYESGSGFREALRRTVGEARTATLLTADWLETPLGRMVAVADAKGIVLFDFVDRKGLAAAMERVRRRYGAGGELAALLPGKNVHLQKLSREVAEYFAGTRMNFTVQVEAGGSEFSQRAWKYLRGIPYGESRSYAEQAREIGDPKAVRAVARANGMNYVSIVIPCHRVVGSNGELTGYGGGLARKQWLLEHEKKNARSR